jgi:hypothetical protein
MVGKYNSPDVGFVKNLKSRADKYRNFDESAAYARKRSINELPLSPDPNVLHKFASYNTIFTLSALSATEIRNPAEFFGGAAHDIIARSGGIGDGNFSSHQESSANNRESRRDPSNQLNKTIDKAKAGAILGESSRIFKKDRDIYFKSVEMTSVPGLNDQRRLTSVTNIMMQLVEPSGLTLIERIRAAAFNNRFLDHLDAPYMLTIEFKGFDENGQEVQVNTDYTKRVIPIKLVTMDIDVNQGGSYYNIKAIPYNEFALVNNFMYPRTSGTLGSSSINKRFTDAVQDLQRILNEQNEDETVRGYNQYPDKYNISISSDLDPEQQLDYELLAQAGMQPGSALSVQTTQGTDTGGGSFNMEFLKFNSSQNILKILEELMKTHPKYGAKSFKEWETKVQKGIGVRRSNPNEGLDSHFKYFRIRTGIDMTERFDELRKTHAKVINIVVEPFYISAYNLATAGIEQDKHNRAYVAKEYNYIFTGDNVDILDLDINYKVAYFQARLKDLEASEGRRFTEDNKSQESDTGSPASPNKTDLGSDNFLPLKSETIINQSSKSGRTAKGDTRVDQFFDYITHPKADMVVVNMDILGDPAWVGQSQFIPATPTNSSGSSQDNNIDFFRGGKSDNVWNPNLRCFNYDVADPVIELTFKTPQDFDDKTGVYEMSSAQRAVFSGLYKVTQVQHNFTDGKFTQTLTMVRFNNQDGPVTKTTNQKITTKNGKVTSVSEKNPMAMSRIDELSGTLGSS